MTIGIMILILIVISHHYQSFKITSVHRGHYQGHISGETILYWVLIYDGIVLLNEADN